MREKEKERTRMLIFDHLDIIILWSEVSFYSILILSSFLSLKYSKEQWTAWPGLS